MFIMKKTYLIVGLFALLAMTGCKKYLDINENPSFPQLVKAELLLAPIIFQMANGYSQDLIIMNKFNQTILGGSADDVSKIWERHGYRNQSDVGGVMWRMVYYNHGHNLQLLIDDAIANQKYEYAGIGYAVKAWGYQMLTDYHGPIIMDEALRAQQLRFSYNDQDEVYAKVREWCDSALYYFDQQSPVDYINSLNSEKGDNLYRGNIARWKKFVYGLKATQFNHLVNKSEYQSRYADSVIRYVDLSFESNADDARIKFKGDDNGNSNVFSSNYGVITSSYYNRAGKPIVRYLTGGLRGEGKDDTIASIDRRLAIMLNRTSLTDSTFKGGEPNVTNSTIPSVLGRTVNNVPEGKYIFRNNAEFPIMTYAQLQLIKAEAQFIKGDKAAALVSYRQAIIGHMNFVNSYANIATGQDKAITTEEITEYLNSDDVAQTADDLTLADIMGQKYIVQWGWGGLEQWCDLRKYNYSPDIFRQYIQLSGSQLQYNAYCYRVRPRYNSEYVWNSDELAKWGGLEPEYVTKPTWFVLPN